MHIGSIFRFQRCCHLLFSYYEWILKQFQCCIIMQSYSCDKTALHKSFTVVPSVIFTINHMKSHQKWLPKTTLVPFYRLLPFGITGSNNFIQSEETQECSEFLQREIGLLSFFDEFKLKGMTIWMRNFLPLYLFLFGDKYKPAANFLSTPRYLRIR